MIATLQNGGLQTFFLRLVGAKTLKSFLGYVIRGSCPQKLGYSGKLADMI